MEVLPGGEAVVAPQSHRIVFCELLALLDEQTPVGRPIHLISRPGQRPLVC
jgi:hypothetical protein